jgi:hypothetical protein
MGGFWQALKTQRWDDHRYYHHSRINQALHLVSAASFLCAYVMAFFDPAVAAHEYKEEIKVGYNLQRKIVLLTIWALSPLPLYFDPTLFGIFRPHAGAAEYVRHVATVWLFLGLGGLLFRTVQLFLIRDVQTGLVWMTKILTDPFHDIKLYWAAPFCLLRGELIDHAELLESAAPEHRGR